MKLWKPPACLIILATIFFISPFAVADPQPATPQAFEPILEQQVVQATPVPQDLATLFGDTTSPDLRFLSSCEEYCDILLDRCYDECVWTPSCGCNGGFDACDDDYDACIAGC